MCIYNQTPSSREHKIIFETNYRVSLSIVRYVESSVLDSGFGLDFEMEIVYQSLPLGWLKANCLWMTTMVGRWLIVAN